MKLRTIKDKKSTKLAKLVNMLAESKISDSANECDDIILLVEGTESSDLDVIKIWETQIANQEERNEFMKYLSDRLDELESLDDSVCDYIKNQGLDPSDSLALLNEWLPSNTKKELCRLLERVIE